jgi:drug/metabolite transporter (DMT)-like permease
MSTTQLKSTATVVCTVDDQAVHGEGSSRSIKGFLPEIAALSVIIVWGSIFTLTKSAYTEFQPLAFGFARFVIIVLISFAVLAVHARRNNHVQWWRIKRQDLPLFVLTGICGYTFYQLGFMLGLAHTSPFSGSLMISLQPIVTLGIVTLLGERQPLLVWAGVLVSLGGVALFLANGDGESQLLGNLISFGGGVAFALYQVFNRRLIREYPPATYSAYSTLFGAIPLLLISAPVAMRQDWGLISTQSWVTLVYMCVFPVYLAYILWGWVISKRGVAISGLTLLVPIIAGVMAVLFFDESFGPRKLLGGALALAGLLVMQQANRRANARSRAAASSETAPATRGG